MNNSYLLLADGTVFKGKSFGAEGDTKGEVVFTTNMAGYNETLTDPDFFGQIVVQTFPLMGNYGVISSDFESDKVHLKGYIVRQWCEYPSNFRSEKDVDTFFKEKNIFGLCGIDTRKLTKLIREKGVMNGLITTKDPDWDKAFLLEQLKEYKVNCPVMEVTDNKIKEYPSNNEKYRVLLFNFGCKKSLISALNEKGCSVILVPAGTPAEEALNFKSDGIVFSNGPGDPCENREIIENIKIMIKSKIPMMGIALGHQLLALANGADSAKQKYGHRGPSQPVKDINTDKIYITNQNHGYVITNESVDREKSEISFINVNDKTCEGIRYKNIPALSVQFFPEICRGPLDTSFLYDEFITLMKKNKL